MENASKALLMAGGILVGVLILALMVTLFLSSRELSTGYEQTKQSEAVQQFNVNFTKYLGQNLTIHQVVTICNFAYDNTTHKVSVNNISDKKSNPYTVDKIKDNLDKKYKLTIPNDAYDENGYITKIQINSN